jgi:hypothetical protein
VDLCGFCTSDNTIADVNDATLKSFYLPARQDFDPMRGISYRKKIVGKITNGIALVGSN